MLYVPAVLVGCTIKRRQCISLMKLVMCIILLKHYYSQIIVKVIISDVVIFSKSVV